MQVKSLDEARALIPEPTAPWGLEDAKSFVVIRRQALLNDVTILVDKADGHVHEVVVLENMDRLGRMTEVFSPSQGGNTDVRNR